MERERRALPHEEPASPIFGYKNLRGCVVASLQLVHFAGGA
ncbi:MAG: hypothetical protein ACREIA_04130 [Opitutaceae bacterium]